ncbi:toprim domain-containing protein [Methanothermococcus sp. SCGC AD-155-N22]|nr:toprim domain-containing protein [Methanothermococcus sp. SCGC AD-155-N22]
MKRNLRLQKLIEVIEELKYENSLGIPIIVEGKRDVQSLRKLGIEGIIIPISKVPIFQVADVLIEEGIREVILLTDFDRAGRQYAKEIIVEFESKRIKVNRSFRRDIMKYTMGLKDIESLYNYILKNCEYYFIDDW